MSAHQRVFVEAVTRYCARHGIAVEIRSQGWLIVMRRGERRHFAFGYDIGLNSAIAHRLANDKAATSDLLGLAGVPCIAHTLFMNPALDVHDGGAGATRALRELLRQYPQGVVVKPNEGTSGQSVFHVTDEPGLERAVVRIFSSSLGVSISPYVDIESEVRVVLLDGLALIVYSKERVLGWRHNLDAGARPVVLPEGETRDACAAIAREAAKAIGIRFASIDVVRVDNGWRILEINSGVKMEALGKLHPELAHAAYSAALDKVFE